jgi:hypothetical protein
MPVSEEEAWKGYWNSLGEEAEDAAVANCRAILSKFGPGLQMLLARKATSSQ